MIAADGTHSVIRPYVLGYQPERRYAGYVNWNGLVDIDTDIAPDNQWTTFVGEGKRVSLMPIAGSQFYYFFDVPLAKGLAEDRSTAKADLARYFAGWCEPVQKLIAALDDSKINRIEVHDIEPFPTLVKGRVALLGMLATAPLQTLVRVVALHSKMPSYFLPYCSITMISIMHYKSTNAYGLNA